MSRQGAKWQMASCRWAGLLAYLFAYFLTACLPMATPPHFPTETPTPADTATPTVIWFPSTQTPTTVATVIHSPTPESRPGVGAILMSDGFYLPTEWTLQNTASTSISVGGNELTLALSQPKGYIYSIQEGALFSDFYAEITASTNLCSGLDEYGMLIRYNSPSNFYRFSLSCNGQIRLDRVYAGTPSSPQAWMPSTSVPSAAPSISRLGVWAAGDEMRFFVNDQYQFSVSDSLFPSGALGVFIRSGGETAVTVSFSDLVVRSVRH
ncbi:MAG: hypothetical protein U9Q82_03810 [Chloroflexota bacterium]|nr:hypothetical protein [Chloroflexota bacterium]